MFRISKTMIKYKMTSGLSCPSPASVGRHAENVYKLFYHLCIDLESFNLTNNFSFSCSLPSLVSTMPILFYF